MDRHRYYQMRPTSCARCPDQKYLTVKTVQVSVDSNGKESKNETDLVENLIVKSETHAALQALWGTAAG